jgi:hypothetical protein
MNFTRVPASSSVHQQVPGLLDCPRPDRVLRGAKDPDPADAVLDRGQDVDLGPVEQVGGEEVQRQDPLRLGPQELRPARPITARRVLPRMPEIPDPERPARAALRGSGMACPQFHRQARQRLGRQGDRRRSHRDAQHP